MVKFLIEKGADIKKENKFGITSFMLTELKI